MTRSDWNDTLQDVNKSKKALESLFRTRQINRDLFNTWVAIFNEYLEVTLRRDRETDSHEDQWPRHAYDALKSYMEEKGLL